MNKLKQIISKKLGIGVTRIRFTPQAITHIGKKKETNALARELIPMLRIIPASRIKPQKKLTLAKMKKKKMITSKDMWIRKVRTLRKYLVENKGPNYRKLRQKVKQNKYSSLKALMKEQL